MHPSGKISTRRYDIDWLRVISIGLLIIYHITIGFQPWGVFIRFIQNEHSLQWLWIPMSMLNVWRIPLLFFVSGMGVCFALRKRNWKELLLDRGKRILLPYIFGILFIVPLHVFLWQKYYNQDIRYYISQGHLWFLLNICIYVIIFSPLFFYLKKHLKSRIFLWFTKILNHPLGLCVIILPFVVETMLINPNPYELYAITLHGYLLGGIAFFFGFCLVMLGDAFCDCTLKWRWLFMSFACVLFTIRLIIFELQPPNFLLPIETNLWIFAVFGFAYKYLNFPSKTLKYLSKGAYPIYILHMVFLYLSSYWIFPLHLSTILKFLLVILFSSIGCFLSYELIIRRLNTLPPPFGLVGVLFGLKPK